MAEEGAIFASTRLTLSQFGSPVGCNASQADIFTSELPTVSSCLPTQVNGTKKAFFVADIDNYTFRIEHTVLGKETQLSLRNADMSGKLLGADGSTLRDFTPDSESKGDIISLNEFLQAANVDLDGA
jgi:hypothetical protein